MSVLEIFAYIISAILFIYALLMLLVGRILAYNDVFPRKKPTKEGLESYDVEDITLKTDENIRLEAWFIKSSNNPVNRTLIVLPGWRQSRAKIIPFIKLFADAGFHVFTYDPRSHGASGNGLVTYGPEEGKDLACVLKHLDDMNDVNTDKLGALAFSLGFGGLVYVVAKAERPIFKALVLEGVFANSYDVGEHMLVNRFGPKIGRLIGHVFFEPGACIWSSGKFQHSKVIDLIDKISPTPLMIIRGENDRMAPPESASRIIDRAKEPKEVWINEKGGHTGSYNKYPEEYKTRVLKFLNTHL